MIIGYYGFGNAGDEWLLKKTIDILTTTSQNQYSYLAGPNPSIYTKNSRPIYRKSWISIIKSIKNAQKIIFGGGGIFQDNSSFLSFLYYWHFLFLARIFKKPIVLLGQGISPLNYSLSKALLKWGLNQKNIKIQVRDQDSYNELISYGVSKDTITITKDLAFYNETIPKRPESLPLKQKLEKHPALNLGVSFRQMTPQTTIINLITHLYDNPSSTKTTPTITYIHTQANEDKTIMEHWPKPLSQPSSHLELLDLFKKESQNKQTHSTNPTTSQSTPPPSLDHILTMRYHTAIWAILNGIPCTIIPVDQKLVSLAKDYGLEILSK